MSVEYICWYLIYHANSWGDECKLVSFCVPFGRIVGEYIYFKIYLCVEYMLQTILGVYDKVTNESK